MNQDGVKGGIMENVLKSELDLKMCEQVESSSQSRGYICESKLFSTDKYGKIFVKFYGGATSRRMFDGEYESLQALKNTNSITVPNAISVLDIPDEGSALALEFVEMQNLMKFQGKLGEELARLHLFNPDTSYEHSNKFGFHVNACYGHYPVENSWKDDWIVSRSTYAQTGNREVIELWSQLLLVIPNFFKGLFIKPSLLHGDLWLGNVGETISGPVIMEKILMSSLGLSVCEPLRNHLGGGGCISESKAYNTDKYGKIFVKLHHGSKARAMFDGEYASLKALADSKTVSVPNPISVLDIPQGSVFAVEYVEMKGLRKFQAELGNQLARLHLFNPASSDENSGKFGFHVNTCCGYIPMENSWNDDWVNFYSQQRLEVQIKLVLEKHSDRELIDLWSQLQLVIPNFFQGIEVKPSLLHGDLWSGNAAETDEGPVIYDPASFWGHHEYDLAIGKMFGGFTLPFHQAYHKLIPQAPGFEMRQKLYILFHQLNHWNHFGEGYRQSSLSLMRKLLKHQ
ncbi:hypothetical protein J437_LFUL002069 [Ladona fulva]|uniref:protein-ribulosamine 3-kinase n=1 Tax=Ladona fulva TaxID=123851 RepID=A0A8K0K3Y1_LADFU|nr:hypothetical protein J437_LFUL002069 [Ladona fulva]